METRLPKWSDSRSMVLRGTVTLATLVGLAQVPIVGDLVSHASGSTRQWLASVRYDLATPDFAVQSVGRFDTVGETCLPPGLSHEVAVLRRAHREAPRPDVILVAPERGSAVGTRPSIVTLASGSDGLRVQPVELAPPETFARFSSMEPVDDLTQDGVDDVAVVWDVSPSPSHPRAVVSIHAGVAAGFDASSVASVTVNMPADEVRMASMDVDRDANAELLVTTPGDEPGVTYIRAVSLRTRPDGTWETSMLPAPVQSTGRYTELRVVPDLDLDGRRELAVAHRDAACTCWEIRPLFDLEFPYAWRLGWEPNVKMLAADVDRDGRDELVVSDIDTRLPGDAAGTLRPGQLTVYRASATGPSQTPTQTLFGERSDSPLAAELVMHIRGVGDVLMTRAVQSTASLVPVASTWDARNLGSGIRGPVAMRIRETPTSHVGIRPSAPSSVDMDGDGTSELVMVSERDETGRTCLSVVRPTSGT